jgi:hypothetical protein
MLPRIVLIALQTAAAWLGAPAVLRLIPIAGDPRTFVHAAVFAVIVFLVGVLGALVLKEIATPSAATLSWTLALALCGAALLYVPGLIQAIPLKFDRMLVPLVGALVGYGLRK